MRHWPAVGVVCLIVVSAALVYRSTGLLAAKGKAWQQLLERADFQFREHEANAQFSAAKFDSDCKVQIIRDPKKWWLLEFRFERDGKEVLSLVGHEESVFRAMNGILYFARTPQGSCGCQISAYDLTNGTMLWETDLNAAGDPQEHFAYSNRVTMSFASLPELDSTGEGVLVITGRESFGDYIEIVDRATGKILAHKLFRQGFGR